MLHLEFWGLQIGPHRDKTEDKEQPGNLLEIVKNVNKMTMDAMPLHHVQKLVNR